MWQKYKRNSLKYNSHRVELDGHSFPSKLEAAVYQMLCLMEKAKEIKDIKRQVGVDLTDALIRWKVDFSFRYFDTDELVFVEAKGIEDDRFKIIKKLWPHYGYGTLQIWKGNYRAPSVAEIIELRPSRALFVSKVEPVQECHTSDETPGTKKPRRRKGAAV